MHGQRGAGGSNERSEHVIQTPIASCELAVGVIPTLRLPTYAIGFMLLYLLTLLHEVFSVLIPYIATF